jgi:hypothetical protein
MLKHLFFCALLLLLLLPPADSHVASVPAPEDVLGFRPGDDRKLAGWPQTVEYFRRLAASSPRQTAGPKS